MRISYSALEAFNTCPAKYKFQYIDRIKSAKSKEAVFGTLVHESLKHLHDPSYPRPMGEDELLQYFTDHWNSDVYKDKQEEAFAFHQGIDILKKYYLSNQENQSDITALEIAFQAPVSSPIRKEFHTIIGRIDRIDKLPDGTYEIIDYKTSRKMPSQETVDNNLQLFVYYLAILNRWPFLKEENRSVKLSLYYLRHGEKLSTIQTQDQSKEKKDLLLKTIEEIGKSDFSPKISPLCDWCDYQEHCPLFRHKFIREKDKSQENIDIENVVFEFLELKEKQSQENKRLMELKGLINQHCDNNNLDRIFTETGSVTRSIQKRSVYDFEKIREILEPIGKWNSILKVDTIKFNKLVSSLPYEIQIKIEENKKGENTFKVISTSRKKS